MIPKIKIWSMFLLLSLSGPLFSQAEDAVLNDSTEEFLEIFRDNTVSPAFEKDDGNVEDFILQSYDSIEEKIRLLRFMAAEHEKKEKYADMIRILYKINEIPGIGNAEKAANSAYIGHRASIRSTLPGGGNDPELLKISEQANQEAFQFGRKAFAEAKKAQARFDSGIALMGYAAAVNTPEAIGTGLETVEELLSLSDRDAKSIFQVLNHAILLCSLSGASGHYEDRIPVFQKRKLDFCQTDDHKALILIELAKYQAFTLLDAPEARKNLNLALSGKIEDQQLKKSLLLFQDCLADED